MATPFNNGDPLDVVRAKLNEAIVQAESALQPGDNIPWDDIIGEPPVGNSVFVDSASGSDGRDGRNLSDAVATIEQAVTAASGLSGRKAIIVYPGNGYDSDGHIDLPADTCVVGAGSARATPIRPTSGNEQKNVFRADSGCYVTGFSFEGWQVDSLTNPTEGAALAFKPGAVIFRAPYIFNCTVYRPQPTPVTPPPMDPANGNPLVGNGPAVIIADGSVISQYSPVPNIMAWGATPSTPNGLGYVAKNGAFINAVNAIALSCHKAYLALSGGQITLSGCSTQFGDYSIWSEGSCEFVVPANTSAATGVFTADAALVESNEQAITDYVWTDLVSQGLTSGWTTGNTVGTDEYFTRRDTKQLLLAIRYALQSGQARPVERFSTGMFGLTGAKVYELAKEPAFLRAWDTVANQIAAIPVSSGAQTMVDGMIAALKTTVQAPDKRKQFSLVTAINTQVSYPTAGVTIDALPVTFRGTGRLANRMEQALVRKDGGRIVFSGQDDASNAILTEGLVIDASTGTIRGPAFERSIEDKALEAAIAGSF